MVQGGHAFRERAEARLFALEAVGARRSGRQRACADALLREPLRLDPNWDEANRPRQRAFSAEHLKQLGGFASCDGLRCSIVWDRSSELPGQP